MEQFLYGIVGIIARLHSYILGLNDQYETSFTDKSLHFIVMGVVGMLLVFAVHPLFMLLSKTGHTIVISFFYVLTVIIVITFAVEIGQGATGTGAMEFDDIMYGVVGFLFFFVIFAMIRGVILLIAHFFKDE